MTERQREDGVIAIIMGDTTYRGNYLTDLEIDDARINEMLKTQPARYVFWARMAAMQRAIYEKKRSEFEKYEAQVDSFIRSERERHGEKVTDKIVEQAVHRDTRRSDLQDGILRAKLQLDLLTAITLAFAQRKDMLMSLGANLREEMTMSGGLTVREKQFIEQRERARKGAV